MSVMHWSMFISLCVILLLHAQVIQSQEEHHRPDGVRNAHFKNSSIHHHQQHQAIKGNKHHNASSQHPHHHAHQHHPIYLNLSSPEFLAVTKRNLKKISDCLFTHFYEKNNPQGHVFPNEFIFPADAEVHFQEIHNAIKPFLSNRVHSYAGYDGPWIENIWISHFSHKHLSFFRGLIPIFLNWIDSEIVKEMPKMIDALKPVLRKNVAYITVTQGDAGLHEAAEHFPNILSLSAGGFGHIPLPLIKGDLPSAPLSIDDIAQDFHRGDTPQATKTQPYFEFDFAFYGTDRKERHRLLMRVKEESEKHNLTFTMGYGKDWYERMKHTKINLAPRGYGRSSFRFAETIHMGRIPLYLYDDFLWLPYSYTPKSADTFAFVAKYDQIPDTIAAIARMTLADYEAKLKRVQEIRHEYTYAGVMKQIEMFIFDPQGPHGGDLKCLQHPRTFFCCG